MIENKISVSTLFLGCWTDMSFKNVLSSALSRKCHDSLPLSFSRQNFKLSFLVLCILHDYITYIFSFLSKRMLDNKREFLFAPCRGEKKPENLKIPFVDAYLNAPQNMLFRRCTFESTLNALKRYFGDGSLKEPLIVIFWIIKVW